jgi:hypothetical protein
MGAAVLARSPQAADGRRLFFGEKKRPETTIFWVRRPVRGGTSEKTKHELQRTVKWG